MSYFRVSTANSYDATINRISQRTAELTSTQEKLSAGKRVLKASDDPVAATLAERESNRLMRTEADMRALERSRSSLQQAESTLGQMGEVLARFKELLVQGGNASLSASDRRSVAQEMRGLRDQLLNLANTQDTEGNALLGGLGPLNSSGKPFADVFPAGVQYQAIEGQYAATETGLPNRVDGGFALMRIGSGDGYFQIDNQQGSVLVQDVTITDMTALMGTGFFADDATKANFSLAVTWDGTEANLEVTRITDPGGTPASAVVQTISLGAVAPGQTINLQQALGASSLAIVQDNPDPTPDVDYGFQIALQGSVTVPAGAAAGDILSQIELTASEPTNLFASLQKAIDTLEDTDINSTARTQSLGEVHQEMQTGQDRMLLVRGRLGELLLRADSIEGLLQDRSVAGQEELSNLTDLDMVQGISDFQTQQLGLQAALQSYAQVQRLSLFQYIA
jgi:flagellar hook-associated protein 3 FlgL